MVGGRAFLLGHKASLSTNRKDTANETSTAMVAPKWNMDQHCYLDTKQVSKQIEKIPPMKGPRLCKSQNGMRASIAAWTQNKLLNK